MACHIEWEPPFFKIFFYLVQISHFTTATSAQTIPLPSLCSTLYSHLMNVLLDQHTSDYDLSFLSLPLSSIYVLLSITSLFFLFSSLRYVSVQEGSPPEFPLHCCCWWWWHWSFAGAIWWSWGSVRRLFLKLYTLMHLSSCTITLSIVIVTGLCWT